MNWFLIVNDAGCRQDLQTFLKKNKEFVIYKSGVDKGLKHINDVLSGSETKSTRDILVINSSNAMHVLKICDIIHCTSNHSYSQIHLINGKKFTVSKPLKQFEVILKQHHFTRVHQSHLVNLNYVDKYVKGAGGYLVLTNGIQLPVATRKKEQLMRELENI